MKVCLILGIILQGIGLALIALGIGLFKSSNYKREFTLFALSGLTLVTVGSVVKVIPIWTILETECFYY